MNNDRRFINRAIEIAVEGIDKGNGPFGAVIAKNGRIISEAVNSVVHLNDPTAHAEILAIRKASEILSTYDLSDCTLYTSCEPCPMCLGAVYWSGIKKVVYSNDRTDAELAGFSDKMIYDELALEPGKRKISFIRLEDSAGEEIFRKWDEYEGKTPY
ncbi:MAG: nucleoside deaminase [Bacteroidales bacterium]|jgi:guanine deaminase